MNITVDSSRPVPRRADGAKTTPTTVPPSRSQANSGADAEPVVGSQTLQPPPQTFAIKDTHQQIALAAYYLSEARGFIPGHETEDWLAAEAKIAADSAAHSAAG